LYFNAAEATIAVTPRSSLAARYQKFITFLAGKVMISRIRLGATLAMESAETALMG
jgi:hypothetical protein